MLVLLTFQVVAIILILVMVLRETRISEFKLLFDGFWLLPRVCKIIPPASLPDVTIDIITACRPAYN